MALHDALLSEDVPSKKAPHQYAVKKAKDLQSSILQQTGLEASEHKRKRFKRAKQQSYFVLVVHGAICSLSFVLGAVAIYIDALILQRIAMLFPLVLAPYTFIQRRKIEQCGGGFSCKIFFFLYASAHLTCFSCLHSLEVCNQRD